MCIDIKGFYEQKSSSENINDDEYLDCTKAFTVLHDFVPSNDDAKAAELGV